MCTYMYMYMFMYMYMYVYVYENVDVYVCMCMCMYVCMYVRNVRMYVCLNARTNVCPPLPLPSRGRATTYLGEPLLTQSVKSL